MEILQRIRSRAAQTPRHILLPEGEDDRTIVAASKVTSERIARVTLFGEEEKVRTRAAALGVSLTNVAIVDHRRSNERDRLAEEYYQLRRAKGLTHEEAQRQLDDPLFFADLMVRAGKADGSVAGATNTTAHTVRAALQTIGVRQGLSLVSSFFVLAVRDRGIGVDGALIF